MCDHCGAETALYCLQCGEAEHPDGYCYTGSYSAAVCYDCYTAYRRRIRYYVGRWYRVPPQAE